MTKIVAPAVVLSIFSSLPPAFARQPDQRERSRNIRVDEVLRPMIAGLLAKSETFRRQWDVISGSRFIRVTVALRLGMQNEGSARARTAVSRYAHGSIRATIELPAATDLTELVAHEFEHVIEQLEGIDLRTLAQQHADGVIELQNGVFETVRARAAGRQVYLEVYGETDPAVQAAVGGIRRVWRTLSSRSQAERAAKTQETRPNRDARDATVPRPHLHKRW